MRIPASSGLGNHLIGTSPRRITSTATGTGGALQIVGQTFSELGEIAGLFARAEQENRFSDAVARSSVGMQGLLVELDDVQDPEELHRRWTEGVAAIESDIESSYGENGGVMRAWRSRWEGDREATSAKVMEKERKLIINRGKVTLAQELTATKGRLPGAATAQDLEQIRMDGLTAINRKHQSGVLSPGEAMKHQADFLGGIDTYLVKRDMNDNPLRALERLERPGEYVNLDPVAREDFIHTAQSRARQREREREAQAREAERERAERERDRMAVLSRDLDDSLTSAIETGQPMESTADMLAEMRGLGERGADAADKYSGLFGRTADAWAVLIENRMKPFAEQAEAVESLRPAPGAQDYARDLKIYERAAQVVEDRRRVFEADPAGYVQPEVARRAAAAGVDPYADPAAAVAISMDVQRQLGAAAPKVLPRRAAKDLKARFEAADADGKINMIQGLGAFGAVQRNVLAEMELSTQHQFAAGLVGVDRRAARVAMEAADTKPSDIGLDAEVGREARRTVNTDFYSGGMGAVLTAQARITGNPQFASQARELETLTTKLALILQDAEAAKETLWGGWSFLVDDDMAVWLPPGMDGDAVEDGLVRLRENLDEADIDHGDSPQFLEDMRESGVWKNSADGQGWVLYDPVSGAAVTRGGSIFVVRYDEVLKAAASAREAEIDDALTMGLP